MCLRSSSSRSCSEDCSCGPIVGNGTATELPGSRAHAGVAHSLLRSDHALDLCVSHLARSARPLDEFPRQLLSARRRAMLEKIDLTTHRQEDDRLIDDLVSTMAVARADFTLTFRRLAELADSEQVAEIDSIYELPETLSLWLARWRERIALESPVAPAERRRRMAARNPLFLPRNHLVEE